MPDFQDLMRELGREIGVPIEGDVSGSVEIRVDDFPVTLLLDRRAGVDAVVFSADLGAVPEAQELEVYRYMLDANVLWSATADCTLGVNADTRLASICYRANLDGLTGESVGALLAAFVEIGRNWANFVEAARSAGSAPMRGADMFTDAFIRV